ncbi:porin [Burkholderia sp. WSM2230]|uniref:porin n=1 Tax=Burkholderia sp. WSM2230 TaxID=944435 RepID=UPI000417075F|nr:porin [Burkholderia sp. WSM2230]
MRTPRAVCLYGTIDDSLLYVNNEGKGKFVGMAVGRRSSDFGLTGTEDLGGGYKTYFKLENGFSLNSGAANQNGAMFGRQAALGLVSPYGTLSFGTQYDVVVDALVEHTAAFNFAGSTGANAGDVDNAWSDSFPTNTIKYRSPSFHGVAFESMLSMPGSSLGFSHNKLVGAMVEYRGDPYYVSVVYRIADNPLTSLYYGKEGVPLSQQTLTVPWTNPIYGGYVAAASQRVFGTSFGYKFGGNTFSAMYTNTVFTDIPVAVNSDPAGFSARFQNIAVTYSYRWTPAFAFSAGAIMTYAPHSKYEEGILAADYALSKRTDVFLIGGFMHASGRDSTGHTAVAAITNLAPSSTSRQLAIRAGVRHNF